MDTNNNSPTQNSEETTPDIKAMIREIYDYIVDMKHDYDRQVANMQLDRRTVEQLLNVSEATIGRWRSRGVLPYYINSSRASYYLFDDVYVAVKRGQLVARTFDPVEALRRLNAFQSGLMFQIKNKANSADEQQ